MIFVVLAALVLTVFRYARAIREIGVGAALRELAAAVGGGLVAGVWLGIAARGAMRVLAIVSGAPLRFSSGGSLQVLGTFALIGAALGILYAGFFRHALASSGFRFAILLIVLGGVPLTQAALDVIGARPALPQLILGSAATLAVMWLPYGLVLEVITNRLHRIGEKSRRVTLPV